MKKIKIYAILFILVCTLFPQIGLGAVDFQIIGQDFILKPRPGETVRVAYHTSPEAVTPIWNLVDAPEGVTITPEGSLSVAGDAENGTFGIKVISDGIEKIKTVTLKDGFYEDFEQDTPGTRPKNPIWVTDNSTYGRAEVTTDPSYDGGVNKFVSPGNDGAWGLKLDWGEPFAKEGVTTVEFDTTVMSYTNNSDLRWAPLFESSGGDWKARIKLKAWSGTYSFCIRPDGSTPGSDTQLDLYPAHKTWTRVQLVFNLDQNQFDVFLNDARVGTFSMAGGADLQKIVFGYAVDNLAIYTGEKVKGSVEVSSPCRVVNLPPAGKTSVIQYTAVVKDADGQPTGKPVVWSLGAGCEGMTIEPKTGRVTYTDQAKYGVGYIVASTEDGLASSYRQTIRRQIYEFTDTKEPWSGGEIVDGWLTGADNRLVLKDKADGRLTVTARVRVNGEKGNVGMTRVGASEWLFNYDLVRTEDGFTAVNTLEGIPGYSISKTVSTQENWVELKIVIDSRNKIYYAFLNGEWIEGREMPCGGTAEIPSFEYDTLIFKCDVDDACIYNCGNTPPVLTGLNISSPCVGTATTAEYHFLDEAGAGEYCSEFVWSVSDRLDGEYETVSGMVGRNPIFPKEYLGKYIKVSVKPFNAYGVGGTAEESEPVQFLDYGTPPVEIIVNDSRVDGYPRPYFKTGENRVIAAQEFYNARSSARRITFCVAVYENMQLKAVETSHATVAPDQMERLKTELIWEKGEEENQVRVFLFDEDSLFPYRLPEHI